MWSNRWQRFKLLHADKNNRALVEAKGDPRGADKLLRRDVERDPEADMRADPLITDWCRKFGYIPYQILKNDWNPFLGEGAQGRVYGVTKNGKLRAVKLVSKSHGHGSTEEWDVRNRFARVYTSMPEHVRKHFPKIYDMGEYDANENVAEEGNTEYYYYVMEYLQPLESKYQKYFQGDFKGDKGRTSGQNFPVDAAEYDIFSAERYGAVQAAFDRILTRLSATSAHYSKIFTSPPLNLELPTGAEHLKNVEDIRRLADEILHATWSRDLKRSLFAAAKSEQELAKQLRLVFNAKLKKHSGAVKRLASKLAAAGLEKSPYGPEIIKKMRALAGDLIVSELNKFMAEAFNQFAAYIAEQSIPYNYQASGQPGEIQNLETRDVDLLRSGPVTEFRAAMIYTARNYDLNVDDIKAANVMQRGKDLVMVDIGIWGLNSSADSDYDDSDYQS